MFGGVIVLLANPSLWGPAIIAGSFFLAMAIPVGLLLLAGWAVLRLWRKRHPLSEFEE
jgi:hypothetical protein